MEPYSIYIHIPFCKKRCLYCDFVSGVSYPIPAEAYTRQVVDELAQKLVAAGDSLPLSVYIGGGTPSVLSGNWIQQMLKAARVEHGVAAEVTVEMNPADMGQGWMEELMAAGVNRFSIGVQSMSDDRLKWLGRRHSVADIRLAVENARAAGCGNVSVDFIYGTPGTSQEQLVLEMDSLIDLAANHISAYELTIAEGTPLARMDLKDLPGDDQMKDLWELVGKKLEGQGYQRYEVSNYARGGRVSVHNNHYWNGGFYLGIGAGAHGFVGEEGRMMRYSNTPDVDSYLASKVAGVLGIGDNATCEALSNMDCAREMVMLGLRRSEGINLARLKKLLSEEEEIAFKHIFSLMVEGGFVRISRDRIVPTDSGMALADELALRFF